MNYNVKHFLSLCLCSVIAATKEIAAEIFVVDNDSTDGSKDFFANKFSTVQFIWNKENVGFGRANNQVLKHCKGDYILFLNPDIVLPEDFFVKIFSSLDSLSNLGAIGVRMIDGQGKFLPESKRSLPSLLSSFYKMTGLANLFPRNIKIASYYAGAVGENEKGKVDILSGACMLLTADAVKATDGFDEDFFMYGEDIDLSYRIRKAGFANYYLPVTMLHYKGESTQKASPVYHKNFYGAMKIFVKKHYNQIYATGLQPIISVAQSAATLKQKLWRKERETENEEVLYSLMLTSNNLQTGDLPAKNNVNLVKQFTKITQRSGVATDKADDIRSFLQSNNIGSVILADDKFSYKAIIDIIGLVQDASKVYIGCTYTGSVLHSGSQTQSEVSDSSA